MQKYLNILANKIKKKNVEILTRILASKYLLQILYIYKRKQIVRERENIFKKRNRDYRRNRKQIISLNKLDKNSPLSVWSKKHLRK